MKRDFSDYIEYVLKKDAIHNDYNLLGRDFNLLSNSNVLYNTHYLKILQYFLLSLLICLLYFPLQMKHEIHDEIREFWNHLLH